MSCIPGGHTNGLRKGITVGAMQNNLSPAHLVRACHSSCRHMSHFEYGVALGSGSLPDLPGCPQGDFSFCELSILSLPQTEFC